MWTLRDAALVANQTAWRTDQERAEELDSRALLLPTWSLPGCHGPVPGPPPVHFPPGVVSYILRGCPVRQPWVLREAEPPFPPRAPGTPSTDTPEHPASCKLPRLDRGPAAPPV